MSERIKQAILGKEWGDEEKQKTINIIGRADERKPKFVHMLDKVVYLFVLFVAIAGNFVVSVVLVPFLLIMSGFYLYLTLFLIGIAFGALFNIIIHYLEKIEPKHHIIAGFFIPVIALINVYIITNLSNKLVGLLRLLTLPHSPTFVSITYVIAFVLPYFWSRYRPFVVRQKRQAVSY